MDLTLPPTVTDRAFARLAEINGDEGAQALRSQSKAAAAQAFNTTSASTRPPKTILS